MSLRVVENLLAIILIPIIVRTKGLANLFVTLMISGTLDKRENQSLDIFWITWTRTLGDVKTCHISTSCTLLSTFMTFELKIKCLLQHPATINHLGSKKIEWNELSDPSVVTINSLRQLQPGKSGVQS